MKRTVWTYVLLLQSSPGKYYLLFGSKAKRAPVHSWLPLMGREMIENMAVASITFSQLFFKEVGQPCSLSFFWEYHLHDWVKKSEHYIASHMGKAQATKKVYKKIGINTRKKYREREKIPRSVQFWFHNFNAFSTNQ